MFDGKVLVLKVGGSLIAPKDSNKPDYEKINNITKFISRLKQETPSLSIILVHGAGSFGHPEAKSFGLSTTPTQKHHDLAHAISETHSKVSELSHLLISALQSSQIPAISIPPVVLDLNTTSSTASITRLVGKFLSVGLIPVLHGDVAFNGDFVWILSGDVIVKLLCEGVQSCKGEVWGVMYLTNVDGVYRSPPYFGPPVNELNVGVDGGVVFGDVEGDVSGGMKLKVESAVEVARMGVDVWIGNGGGDAEVLVAVAKKERLDVGTWVRSKGK
ncbi:hypothetical protein HK098_005526 [Nowakowskiella sp. JEL0407]|nr:hypothetical protein HK098_005526 [Nowakowskiella sp. JEL0407]